MPATCSLLTKLVNVFKLSMSHCFKLDGHCMAANVAHQVSIKTIAIQHFLRVCTAAAVAQVRWWTVEWQDEPRHDRDMWKDLRLNKGEKLYLYRDIVGGQLGLNWGDGRGLEGEWDRLSDIKDGSGFPCASALFLGDWNVLQEQHKLPRSVMALPPGTVQACLTSS